MTTDPLAALDTMQGYAPGTTVSDDGSAGFGMEPSPFFDDADWLQRGVVRAALAALAATPPAIDPERQRLFEQVRAALKGARGAALDAEEPGLDQELANAIDALDRIRADTDA